ncbi:hypothetical protein ACFLU1_05855 [Chloroflexota bacterium]
MAIRVATEENYRKHLKSLRDEVEKKTGKSPEALFQERQKRLRDAIEMKEPDRVPASRKTHRRPRKDQQGADRRGDSG